MSKSTNHLRIADEALEQLKSLDTLPEPLVTRLKWSMALSMVRAIVAAIEDVADAVRKGTP